MAEEVRFRSVSPNQVLHGPVRPIRFENGFYATSDREEVAFLKGHRWFGNRIKLAESDDAPKPPPMQRGLENEPETEPETIELPCGVEGCSYVARADTIKKATRNRNAHWTRAKHKPEGA